LFAWDIEVLRNYFCVTFVDIKTRSEKYVFIVSPWRNDLLPLIKFLQTRDLRLVGFNSLGYDYAVLHPIIEKPAKFAYMDSVELVDWFFRRSAEVLAEDFRREWKEPLIPQRDLFRVWHFNNKARYTSLKYLQINMHWHDVREMPIHYQQVVKQGADEEIILDYNLNDVLSTIEFYYLSTKKLKMRATLSKKYGRDFGNSPDTRIGEAIFLIVMSKLTGLSEAELKSRKTERKEIALVEAIPEGVYFASDVFGGVLKRFKEMTITNTRKIDDKDAELFSVVFDGMKYDFGYGGLHGVRESGVYHNLDSADVSGYYPSLSISKNIYPHHLGPAFPQAHKVIKDERKQYVKGTDESDALKLSGNGVFGMLNAPWSPFYDPLALLKTTIGGQLLLAQLCEWLTMAGAGRIMMVNTDGFEIEVKNREKYEKICAIWQKEHNLSLDFSKYKTLAIRDVNNYIGVKEDGKVKEKGAYVVEPEIHKNRSMKIVRHAVKEFFVNGVPVEKTIEESTDLKMFIMGKRAKTGNLEWRYAKTADNLIKEPLPKNVRYYVAKSGGSIVKVLAATENKKKKEEIDPDQMSLFAVKAKEKVKKERIVNIHSGWRVNLFNKWVDKPFEEYGIDKNFYVQEAKKLIDPILKVQSAIK
jgi:hypothetical protein